MTKSRPSLEVIDSLYAAVNAGDAVQLTQLLRGGNSDLLRGVMKGEYKSQEDGATLLKQAIDQKQFNCVLVLLDHCDESLMSEQVIPQLVVQLSKGGLFRKDGYGQLKQDLGS